MKQWERKFNDAWERLAREWTDAGNAADILPPMRIGFYAGAIAAASLVSSGKKIVDTLRPLMEAELAAEPVRVDNPAAGPAGAIEPDNPLVKLPEEWQQGYRAGFGGVLYKDNPYIRTGPTAAQALWSYGWITGRNESIDDEENR